MSNDDKTIMLERMTGETDRDILSVYLSLAKSVVVEKAYPFGGGDEVPPKYDSVHVEIAAFMLNKRGAEGEITHSENGVSRSYEDGDIPPTLLRRITPMAVVRL